MPFERCEWAMHKGLWHRACSFFMTMTIDHRSLVVDEIPCDRICPECGKGIVEVHKRRFKEE